VPVLAEFYMESVGSNFVVDSNIEVRPFVSGNTLLATFLSNVRLFILFSSFRLALLEGTELG
jgi:hypothetical protein